MKPRRSKAGPGPRVVLRWDVVAVATALGIFLGWSLARATSSRAVAPVVSATGEPTVPAPREVREPRGRYKFIRPLLRVETPRLPPPPELAALEKRLASQIADEVAAHRVQSVSLYFRDLDTARWVGIDEDRRFVGASLFKVPLMVAYLRRAETEPGLLDKIVVFTPDTAHNATQTIPSPEPLTVGSRYTVRELLRRMIVDSDNDAMQLLLDNAGPEVEQTYADLDATPVRGPDGVGTISPYDYAATFRALYSATVLDRTSSEHAIELLAAVAWKSGLCAGVPAGTVVAHKFGERPLSNGVDAPGGERELHDCGIVYHPRGPYVLCVMTVGNDYAAQATAIADLSRTVWNADDQLGPVDGD